MIISDFKNTLKIKIFIVKLIILLGQKTLFGRGQVRKILINFINFFIGYGHLKQSRFIIKVKGVPFNFYNDKLTGIKFYFGRNEINEIEFIKKNSFKNSVFVDIGSNMGLYTQNIAFLNSLNKDIKIISIEPNPVNIFRLNQNLLLLKKIIPNIFSFVKIKKYALGDKNAKLNFDFSRGLANGYITKSKRKNNIIVQCKKLLDVINEEKINFITNLKIDIEGCEDKVLIPFFKNCKKRLYPKNIILEHSSNDLWDNDLFKFLYKIGYQKVFKNRSNLILSLK